MSNNTNLFERYCPNCLKVVDNFADKCPHCTADISDTSDGVLLTSAVTGFLGLWREILISIVFAAVVYFISTLFTNSTNMRIQITCWPTLVVWALLGWRWNKKFNREWDEKYKQNNKSAN